MRVKQPDILICNICGKTVPDFASQHSINVYHSVTRHNEHGGSEDIDQCLDCAVSVNAFFANKRRDKDGASSKGSK